MALITENPIAIAVVGGLAATLAAVVFLARRTSGALVALAAIVAITILLLVVERVVVTDREAVEASVEEVFDAVERNDLPGVLAWIDPAAAGVRADAEALMPFVKMSTANAAAVSLEGMDGKNGKATSALCRLRAYLNGVHGSSGMSLLYVNQRVDIKWVKRGKRWLISGYTAYYDDQPIDAVGSARGNRPVPGR